MVITNQVSTLQSLAWESGLKAIKESEKFTTFDDFKSYLVNNASQNSQVVRERYSNLIIKRLFPERQLDGLNGLSWRMYHDEKILVDLARFTTLEAEPVIAKFLLEVIIPLPEGSVIPQSVIRDFIASTYGSFKKDSYDRLRTAIVNMGFVEACADGVAIQPVHRPDNAFLIAVHARLAPTPRIIRLSDMLALPFWKLLGIRNEADVRAILKQAETKGLIARYALIDQLEQITTRYTYREYMAGALRL